MVPVRATGSLATAIVMLLVAVSGCVGADEAPQDATNPSTPAPGTMTGAIHGQVTDEEGLPTGGVLVAIVDDGLDTTTDASGVFVFNDLAPGTKRVFVQRLGFESVGRSVSVVAGETATLEVVLKPIRVADPWAETFTGEGFMTCQWSTPAVKSRIACDAISDPERSIFDFPVQPGLSETLTETVWEQTSALSPEYMELDHMFDGSCKECDVVQQSPHVHKSDGYKEFDEEKVIRESYWLPFGNQSQPVIFSFQQRFSVFLTAFYHQGVPEGFSAAPE